MKLANKKKNKGIKISESKILKIVRKLDQAEILTLKAAEQFNKAFKLIAEANKECKRLINKECLQPSKEDRNLTAENEPEIDSITNHETDN